jgi:hypothetical protein
LVDADEDAVDVDFTSVIRPSASLAITLIGIAAAALWP